MSGLADKQIDRYAGIQLRKLGIDAWEPIFTGDEVHPSGADYVALLATLVSADPLAGAQLAYPWTVTVTEDPRAETGAANAATLIDREAPAAFEFTVDATEGENLRMETELVFQQDRFPHLEFIVTMDTTAEAETRWACGLSKDVSGATVAVNSPTIYAEVGVDDLRGFATGNVRLFVAGTADVTVYTVDASAASGSELTDETTNIFDSGAGDVLLGATAGNAAVGDALVVCSPFKPHAIIFTVGTAEAGVHTELYQYWSGSAWTAFTPDGTAPRFDFVGRVPLQIPQTAIDAMVRIKAGDLIGPEDDTADAITAGGTPIGKYGVRIGYSAIAAAAPADLNYISVEQSVSLGVAINDNTEHHVMLRLTPGNPCAAEAQIDDNGWRSIGRVFPGGGTTRDTRLAVKVQQLAATEDKEVTFSSFKAGQFRQDVTTLDVTTK